MRPTGDSPTKTGNLFRLPVRTQHLNLHGAAVYLGISPIRLKLLIGLGAGPTRQGDKSGHGTRNFRIEELDQYIGQFYEQADISSIEALRRREARAHLRQVAMTMTKLTYTAEQNPADPFMVIMTRWEIAEHAIFFFLKAMALFGIIMLCISSSPLLKTHF
ncbi:hypothetical protein AA101099_2099 [Neoasaia chiangmaiensis NBRC 101099]|uniref:Uncharacterized protein n=1 Tax=Neoasaia chiangmaiensis TaxID=320497 RepID=A0A1U9KSW9_9PROT|nr:hypothetical protein [Neoasaia chiangmaiensis]AQS88916.1 hypothetical protein A0U93_14430 [Neoasaia chiangmaiensis]GBR40409.1 hypothetical protein AA101099_2099 [Neoasaia chiangmaiensis NBRC 101099]GEN13913.1 hypothetical protein NCH01_03440 [Neoasaia chiangmaiensis]